jgi:PHD/YefM family antitoxin component YafN of YafNO toxin-antitoxin module
MSVQMIEKNGKPEWAVLPYEEYERLVEEAEMLRDVRAYDEAKKAVAAGEELVPSEVTYGILDGANVA